MQSTIRTFILTGCCLTAAAAMGGSPERLGERTPLKPPFCQQFDDYPAGSEFDQFDRFYQIINEDGDKNPSGSDRSWGLYNFNGESGGRQFSKCAYLQYPYDVRNCDDWLIPWAIRLEGGKYYYVSVDASLYADFGSHTFEIKMGEYNDIPGLEVSVVPSTTISSIVPERQGGWFHPEFDGLYYMGIHGTSSKTASEGNYLFIDNISCEAGRSGREPGEVTDIKFTPFSTGEPGATVSFRAPEAGVDGNPISGNVTVVVARNGATLRTFTLTPGETASLDDSVPEATTYTYSFTCSNNDGTGIEYRVNKFIGLSVPMAPVVTSIVEAGRNKVTLSWEAPTTDLRGEALDTETLRYNIYEVLDYSFQIRETLYAGTDYTCDIDIPAGSQKMVTLAVSAVLGEDMESPKAVSDYVILGDPYKLPYICSFGENDTDDYIIGADGDEGISWRILDEFSDPQPQDDDHGYVAMIGTQYGQYGELTTGKLDFTDVKAPYLNFYVYAYEDDENELSVEVYDYETGSRTSVTKFPIYELSDIGWCEVKVPLSAFTGKIVRVIIGAKILSHGYVPLDNIVVTSMPSVDLAVKVAGYTTHATLGETFGVDADVSNFGSAVVNSFTATLLQNDKPIDSVTGGPIESFGVETVSFSGSFSADSPDNSVFKVIVSAEDDENEANDTTEPFNIAFLAPTHPAATNLKVAKEGNDVVLDWTAPDISKAAPESETEDFESYPSFTTELRNFTMIDADEGFVTGFSADVDFPVKGTQQAYWTQRCEEPFTFLYTCDNSSLFCMASVNESRRPIRNDDWLVSPLLYGGRQNISFMAVSQTIQYGYETFEVYASSTDNNIESFSKVMYETKAPQDWKKYYVSLPEGTKYFAIRCTSNDCMLFTLDDITYIPAGIPRALELEGYNVYRNGEQISTSLVKDTNFRIPSINEADRFFVTAVYKEGESVASNVVSLSDAGVSEIADSVDLPAVYYNLNGIKVASDRLTPGIYIRCRGQITEKVIIR